MPKRFIFALMVIIIAFYPTNKKEPEKTEEPLFYDYKGHRWIYEDKADSFKLNTNGLYIPKDSIVPVIKASFRRNPDDTVAKILTEDDIIMIIENEKY